MAYKYKLLLIFFSIHILNYSQNKSIDSEIEGYRKQISVTLHDTVKINLYKKIAEVYNTNKQQKKAIETQEKALTIARNGKHIFFVINLLKLQAYYNSILGDYTNGLLKIKEAIKLAKKRHYGKLSELYLEESWLNFLKGENDSLRISANNMLKYSEDYDIIVQAHNFLGSVYVNEHKFRSAMEKYILIRDIAIAKNDVYRTSVALSNIAAIHFETEHFEDAILIIEKAMKLGVDNSKESVVSFCLELKAQILIKQEKYKEAGLYLKQAEEINVKNDFFELITEIRVLQAEVYKLQKQYDLSIKKYIEVIDFEKKMESNLKQSLVYTNLAQIFYDLKKVDSSLHYLNLANKSGIMPASQLLYNELLSKIYADKKEFNKAYSYFKGYTIVKDSLDSIARKKEAYILEADYQFKQKEDEIEILNTKSKLRESQIYLLIGFVGVTLLLLFFIYGRFKIKERINKELEELDKTKTRFFTNISHEFRTPLSLMLGPIQTVLKNTQNADDKTNLNLAYKNGTRLDTMINQLLDLSKIESNTIPLEVEEMMIPDFLKVIFSYFNSMAIDKEIDYQLDIAPSINTGYLDKDKIEKILINLLSNAFKFTPIGGSVKLYVQEINGSLSVTLKDSGIGIHKDEIDKIFNRFYQIDDSQTRTVDGSGIGLALSKELANTHKGSLKAMSIKGQGSVFTLKTPIKKRAYQIHEMKKGLSLSTMKYTPDVELIENKLAPSIAKHKKDTPLLLIVEDNVDMQNFIASILQVEYNILIASNGKEAYSIALEEIPDIIISDYMMPIVDGMSFSKMIRDQEATSHIPIVMLTAKNEQFTKLESLETGVSSFLTKPFNTDELLLVVNNIMEQQERIKKRYTNNYILTVKEIKLPDSEKNFIEKMGAIFEDKHESVYFGVEELSDGLCLSRVQLYRKVKALTGESPSDLLRVFRLEKARVLLKKSSSNVGEISEKVGFGNASNFSNKFKKHTGMSPSDYINKQS